MMPVPGNLPMPMPHLRSCRSVRSLAAACFIVLAVGGCGGHVLSGKVVSGGFSGGDLVSERDARLTQEGMGGVSILVIRDADRARPETVARGTSRPDGSFRIPVESFGAGWMLESWKIVAAKRGEATAEYRGPLPSGDERLLFLLAPGTYDPAAESVRSSLLDEVDAYRR